MNTPDNELPRACARGDSSSVTALISRLQTSEPSYNPPFQSMLYSATNHDRVNVAKYCVEHGAAISSEIMNILLIARSKAVYEFFLNTKIVDVNFWIPNFRDVLSVVARKNVFEWARLCLSHGVDPNMNSVDRRMSILASVAEFERGSVEMAALLIEHGAKVNGSCAIVMAAEEGKLDMVGLLLEKGAGIDEVGIEHPMDPRYIEDVGSALHRAVVGGHSDIVKFLLEKGANMDLKDGLGRTALELAEESGNHRILEMLKQQSPES